MTSTSPTQKFDAIIIAGGHNGLTCAAMLGQAGKRVLLLETRELLGRAGATEGLFPGFHVSSGSPEAGLFRPEISQPLFLKRHGLEWLTPPAWAFTPASDGRALTLWVETAYTQVEIARFSARDAERYPAFLEQRRRMGALLAAMAVLTLTSPIVLSAANPRLTLFNLLGADKLPLRTARRIDNIRFRGSTAVLHIAQTGLPEFNEAQDDPNRLTGQIILGAGLDAIEAANDNAKYGQISDEQLLKAFIPTVTDPELAPAGQHLLSVQIQYAPYALQKGTWEQVAPTLAQKVLDHLERAAPGLQDLVLSQRLISPADWETAYGMAAGHIHHGQHSLDQLLFMRPAPGLGRYRTPIEGLYLCGAGSHPGGGITGAPAIMPLERFSKMPKFHRTIWLTGLVVLFGVGLLACSGKTDDAPPKPTLSAQAARGKDVFTLYCAACHSTSPDAVIVGPSLVGVRERAEDRVVGQSAEEYLMLSILRPDDYLVEGYEDNMPPDLAKRLTGEEMDAVLAYIVTLE